MTLPISQAAFDLIVAEETGGPAYYNAREIHPDWPGGASGVTIGIGYDCGYSDAQTIRDDWDSRLPFNAVAALASVAGIHGSPASSHAHELHWISVPWDAALAVFSKIDVPKWSGIVEQHLPNCDKLTADCFGALVSLAFNRGASFDLAGERYTEMRAIKAHMAAQAFDKIPDEFLAMRRLWPKGGDLWNRRGHEAALFDAGLHKASAVTQALPPADKYHAARQAFDALLARNASVADLQAAADRLIFYVQQTAHSPNAVAGDFNAPTQGSSS